MLRKIFSQHGFTILVGVALSMLLIVVNPLGVQFGKNMNGMVKKMTGVVDINKAMNNMGGNTQPQDTKTYELVDGLTVNNILRNLETDNNKKIKSIEFVDTTMPTSGVTAITGFDADGDNGVVGWYTPEGFVYISTQNPKRNVSAHRLSWFMFSGLTHINAIDASKLDTSNVINMSSMFSRTGRNSEIFNLNLNNWDTSHVVTMSSMFNEAGYNATTWNINGLNNFNTSMVTRMDEMFMGAAAHAKELTIDLSGWDVSSCLNFKKMFNFTGNYGEKIDIKLKDWDLSKTSTTTLMFYQTGYSAQALFKLDVSGWNVSNVTNMNSMFEFTGRGVENFSIIGLDDWDVSNVTDMCNMFQ